MNIYTWLAFYRLSWIMLNNKEIGYNNKTSMLVHQLLIVIRLQ